MCEVESAFCHVFCFEFIENSEVTSSGGICVETFW